ncbi:hypothetical protein NC652_019518 [Populus alba x Populus x berolinensis]|nr:hypothetical protein NC652_019518 [Populus alba x Populus x berolinensis]
MFPSILALSLAFVLVGLDIFDHCPFGLVWDKLLMYNVAARSGLTEPPIPQLHKPPVRSSTPVIWIMDV